MSEKIQSQHLARKAILYIRQSSPYQVMNNLESQKLQYAMEARLRRLGWNEIEIIISTGVNGGQEPPDSGVGPRF